MEDILEKHQYFILLYDLYGGLLTPKQQTIFDLYYQNSNVNASIKNENTTVYGGGGGAITFETAFPFLTIYDYGGQMIFNNITVEE